MRLSPLLLLLACDPTVVDTTDSDGGHGSDSFTGTDTLPEDTGTEPVDTGPRPNTPPSVDAGSDIVADELTQVQLEATASDPDGEVVGWAWEQLTGPAVSWNTADAPIADFITPSTTTEQTVTLLVTVTDDRGDTGTDTVDVAVAPVNLPPTVDAGLDHTVEPLTTVALAGSAADADGSIASAVWDQLSGTPGTWLEANDVVGLFQMPEVSTEETLELRLTVTDNEGATASDTASFTVRAVNLPPVANAGADQAVIAGALVTLDGSASSDPDGSITTWAWEVDGAPIASTGAVATWTAPSVTADTSFTATLTVTDDRGATHTDTAVIAVSPPNLPPVANAGADQTVIAGALVTLDGSASSDPDGSITTWAWEVDGAPIASTGAVATWTAPTVTADTSFTATLTVTDDRGATHTDTAVIAVSPPNLPPVANAGADQAVIAGALVTLDGSASSDPDGSITAWAWEIDGAPISSTGALATWTAPTVTADTSFTATLTVTDDRGATHTDTAVIQVAAPDLPPVVDAGPEQWVVAQTPISLVAIANDPDGTIAQVLWEQISGPTVSFTATDTLTTDIVASEPLQLQEASLLRVTVTDNEGLTASAELLVHVAQSGPVLATGTLLDFESNSGDLFDPNGVWEWGIPTTGPKQAATGQTVWATKLGGNYPPNADASLYLPLLDLTNAPNPSLGLRVWMSAWGGGDGVRLERWDADLGWTILDPDVLPYDGTNGGKPLWNAQGYHAYYPFAGVSLAPWAGTQMFVRLRFVSTPTLEAAGAYIDDIALYDESMDPDGDGAPGLLTEILDRAGDPFLADTDGDGFLDGEELGLSDAFDPTDYPGAPTLPCGTQLPLELDDGGLMTAPVQWPSLATTGSQWEWGTIGGGPGHAATGANGWATVLNGNHTNNATEVLHLPPLDLTTCVDPTLSLRLWKNQWGAGDGVSLEIWDGLDWVPLAPATPAQEILDPSGAPAWSKLLYRDRFPLVALPLTDYAGQIARVRVVFRSDNSLESYGAIVDDIAVTDELDDPDGDGVPGVLNEMLTRLGDPFLADTDGDGFLDGEEQGLTDAFDPTDYPGAPTIPCGTTLPLDLDDGGLATAPVQWPSSAPSGDQWAWGPIVGGPGHGATGPNAWATVPNGKHANSAIEVLHLPPLDLTSCPAPTLSMRLWKDTWGSGDGVSFEIWDGLAWTPLPPATPAQPEKDAGGVPAWITMGYRDQFSLVAVSLNDYAGGIARVRMMFRSTDTLESFGPTLDDIALFDEGADPDGDGIPGLLAELLGPGTDPFLTDSDGDGISDGDEVAAGTDPLDPAISPFVEPLFPGTFIDFELGNGGLGSPPRAPVTSEPTGTLWAWGAPTGGPGAAYSGQNVWATNLTGNYFGSAREYLNLPPLDLTTSPNPTLAFRLWTSSWGGQDGVSVEAWDGSAWVHVDPALPAHNDTDPAGQRVWNHLGYHNQYALVLVPLDAFSGTVARVRIAFRSSPTLEAYGALIDDLALFDEAMDADGDGLPGLLTEHLAYGTDPLVTDTDGDGASDGAEVLANTLPTATADSPTAKALAMGVLQDFELDNGGAAPTPVVADPFTRSDGRWAWGTPSKGPARAHSGASAWCTDLGANYVTNDRESLDLPPIDLSTATDPSIAMRVWWAAGTNKDGLSLEAWDGTAWVALNDVWPAYSQTDPTGAPGWATHRYRDHYALVAASLNTLAGTTARLRLTLRADGGATSFGACVDDLVVQEESADPDNDGIPGILAEIRSAGTDPLLNDTDGDGFPDGAEVGAGTDPLGPAVSPNTPTLVPPFSLDFEADNGGLAAVPVQSSTLASTDRLFEWGTPLNGPGVAASGQSVWATSLAGNFATNQREYLELPPVALPATPSATLNFNLWMKGTTRAGLRLELDDGNGWQSLTPVSPAYDNKDDDNLPAWRTQGSSSAYVPVTVDLAAWAGSTVRVRFVLSSGPYTPAAGAYLDDIAVTLP